MRLLLKALTTGCGMGPDKQPDLFLSAVEIHACFEENEIGNTPEEWFARVHPKDIEHLKTKITAHLEGHVHHFQDEHRMLHKDGTYRWMFGRGLAVRNPEGQASRMAGR